MPTRETVRSLLKSLRAAYRWRERAREPDPVERGVLCSVLAKPELVPCVLARVGLEDFKDARVRRILEQCIELYDREADIDHAALTAALQDAELAAVIAEISITELEGGNWEEWLQGCLDRMEKRKGGADWLEIRERAKSPEIDREALAALQEHERRRAGRKDTAGDELR